MQALQKLIQWSLDNYSDLPWRTNRTLYTTLVSEIMLQQTTVSTVLKHYQRFLKEYPELESLTKASEEQLTISWKGLGYYRRARNLKKAATGIFEDYQGEFPLNEKALMDIPGIGRYTANALIAIGADKRGMALDGNLERVLSRLLLVETEAGPKLQRELFQKFEKKQIKIFEKEISYRELNEALMDLGRVYCRPKNPQCLLCPLKSVCSANKEGRQTEIPVKTQKTKKFYQLELARIVCVRDGKVLVSKRRKGSWLEGQYEVPSFILNSEDEKLSQYSWWEGEKFDFDQEFKSTITQYKITNYVQEVENVPKSIDTESCEWLPIDLAESNLSTATFKCLKKLELQDLNPRY